MIPGRMVMHNGRPVELLYQICGDVWRVRPLFVEEPDRDEYFRPGETLTDIHSRARAAGA